MIAANHSKAPKRSSSPQFPLGKDDTRVSPSPNAQRKPEPDPAAREPGWTRPHFDTMKAAGGLVEAGFNGRQAKTIVNVIQGAQGELATKADLDQMESKLEGKMEKMEAGIRSDMRDMEAGIRSDMKDMENRLEKSMHELQLDMNAKFQRTLGFLLLAIGAATGIVSAVVVLAIR